MSYEIVGDITEVDDRGWNQDPRACAAAKAIWKGSLAEDEGCCHGLIAGERNT